MRRAEFLGLAGPLLGFVGPLLRLLGGLLGEVGSFSRSLGRPSKLVCAILDASLLGVVGPLLG